MECLPSRVFMLDPADPTQVHDADVKCYRCKVVPFQPCIYFLYSYLYGLILLILNRYIYLARQVYNLLLKKYRIL